MYFKNIAEIVHTQGKCCILVNNNLTTDFISDLREFMKKKSPKTVETLKLRILITDNNFINLLEFFFLLTVAELKDLIIFHVFEHV